MRLVEIKVEDVLAAKNWLMESAEDGSDPHASEAFEFGPADSGLFSALVKFGDGSVHPALVVKSFERGGDDVDLFVYTKFGWLNIHAGGFMRAVGKYSHEVFPFEYYLGSPWKGGSRPAPDHDSTHPKVFKELASRVVLPPPPGKRR